MSIQITRGIQLSAFDVEMLTSGRLIAVPFKQYRKNGEIFWLYPCQQLPDNLSWEQYYQPEYLIKAENSLAKCQSYPRQIEVWGRCEEHWHVTPEQKHLLPQIAASTVWNLTALEDMFERHQVLKLLFLRVYRLSSPCLVKVPPKPAPFFFPQSEDVMTIADTTDIPVVSEASFNRRKALLLAGEVHPDRDLELLELQVSSMGCEKSAVGQFISDINVFLGGTETVTPQPDRDKDWIQQIAAVGNSSDGNEFEKLVRKGLMLLGFSNDNSNPKISLDPEATGGAGGLDFYCASPYPVVGECKATKTEKVPDRTAAQLIKLGHNHLHERYDNCVKLIIAAGELTPAARQTAERNKISVISPEILQRLVEMQAKYPGCIDLMKLKECFQGAYGLADEQVAQYLEVVRGEIELRSGIVELVKNYLENTNYESAGVEALHGAYFSSHPPQSLTTEQLQEILIELSSPLTGYLGRKGDRFYFLRPLLMDT